MTYLWLLLAAAAAAAGPAIYLTVHRPTGPTPRPQVTIEDFAHIYDQLDPRDRDWFAATLTTAGLGDQFDQIRGAPTWPAEQPPRAARPAPGIIYHPDTNLFTAAAPAGSAAYSTDGTRWFTTAIPERSTAP